MAEKIRLVDENEFCGSAWTPETAVHGIVVLRPSQEVLRMVSRLKGHCDTRTISGEKRHRERTRRPAIHFREPLPGVRSVSVDVAPCADAG